MTRPGSKKETKGIVNTMDRRVVILSKPKAPAKTYRTIPGVSQSITTNEQDGSIKILRFPKGFGKALKLEREKIKVSSKDLAMKINKKQHVISDLEKEDAMFDLTLLKKLEQALGISFDDKYKKGV
ncbi:hypothetical protein NEOKW01_1665 [Nematocida sp. AWRm80]|nr:hypothetical protein NEOKW01_1665 [Nematocida sp. AWRm80]